MIFLRTIFRFLFYSLWTLQGTVTTIIISGDYIPVSKSLVQNFLRTVSSEELVPILNENDDPEDSKQLKTILENQYKFRNDEVSTRFKIASVHPDEETLSDSQFATQDSAIYRAFAVRRIVGGMETSISTYPYNVAISRNGKHWCGGAVVDEQWVFTAGHCLESAHDGDKKKLIPFIVRAGSSFHNRGGYQARINKAFFPRDYSPGNADYDYCLLRLDRPLPIGRNIAVLNLPSHEYGIKKQDILVVTGWGSTHDTGFGHIPDRMRFVPVPVMPTNECQKSYRFYITPRMMCAGYATGGKDACNHDSGGPAVRNGVLLGIVSFGGKQCGDPHSPGVYSRVSEITEWVEATITQNEASTVPELVPKIEEARQRAQKLDRFKARVEDKKNKIKSWLRDTLSSPGFIQLAKKKLKEAGFDFRRTRRSYTDESINRDLNFSEESLEESNLSNLINDKIIENGGNNDHDELIHALAVHETINEVEDKFHTTTSESQEDVEEIVAYVIGR